MIQFSTTQRCDTSPSSLDSDSGFTDGQVDPVRVSIAQLTDLEIDRMEEHDLFDVIEMADILPVNRRLLHSLEFRRIADLKRVALATRTACRDYWLRAQKIAEAKSDRDGRGDDSGGESTATVNFVLRS